MLQHPGFPEKCLGRFTATPGGEIFNTITAILWNTLFGHEPEWRDNKCNPWKSSMEYYITPVFISPVEAILLSALEIYFGFSTRISGKAKQI